MINQDDIIEISWFGGRPEVSINGTKIDLGTLNKIVLHNSSSIEGEWSLSIEATASTFGYKRRSR